MQVFLVWLGLLLKVLIRRLVYTIKGELITEFETTVFGALVPFPAAEAAVGTAEAIWEAAAWLHTPWIGCRETRSDRPFPAPIACRSGQQLVQSCPLAVTDRNAVAQRLLAPA